MRLRQLEIKDAERMLEWMHDESVVKFMATDFKSKTLSDCKSFINNSQITNNYHLAVVDDNDIYMGTVSLKNIEEECAEFAITIHKDAMGKGFAKYATQEIMKIGFEKLNLKYIYWYVSKENIRAIRFYDKNGYKTIKNRKCIDDFINELDVIWYCIENLSSQVTSNKKEKNEKR